ncbi:plant/K24A2-2 protein [Senna tora]|uniref:Plant/K24A2-2 protein n=1 Tax=Senna tora TaxID=362788 RepID=A0A834TLA7_9FABA|nr:plant/K24A2-2 protein [Senna tora]
MLRGGGATQLGTPFTVAYGNGNGHGHKAHSLARVLHFSSDASHFNARIMLKSIDDPHVDVIATASGPLDHKREENIIGNALLRWQGDANDPHTFTDFYVSTSDQILRMRSSAYYPKYGFGAFGIYPLLQKKSVDKANHSYRESSEDYGLMGMRYGSGNLSFGVTMLPFATYFAAKDELLKNAWLVSRKGRVTSGVQYEPQNGNAMFTNWKNWSFAIGYNVGSSSPWIPSFNFCLELVKSSQLVASFYQHMVVQRRVNDPSEENNGRIMNYIDFGFELQTRVDDIIKSNTSSDSTFQVGASWQISENYLMKAKVGPCSSSLALAFKSWWNPSFTFSISAIRDHVDGKMQCGFGIQSDSLREPSYQRDDSNFVMLMPNKEHQAEDIIGKMGERPMLKSDIDAGNFDGLPIKLKPLDKIL